MTKAWRLFMGLALGSISVVRLAGAAEEGREPVTLEVAGRVDYTDNRDASASNEESTFDYYLSPRIDLYMQNARSVLDLYYTPSLRYRTDPSPRQDDTDIWHELGLNASHRFSDRTRVHLNDSFNYRDDPAIEQLGSPTRENRTYTLNELDGGLRQHLSRQTYGDVIGRYMTKRYKDDDVAQFSDKERVDGEARLWVYLAETLLAHVEAVYGVYTFDNAAGIDRDFDLLTGAAGLEKTFSPQVRAGVKVGVQSIEYSDNSLDSKTNPYARGDVTLSPTPAARLKASATHGVRDADVYPFASQKYTEFTGTFELDASAIVTLGVDATIRLSDYDVDMLPAGAPNTITGAVDGDETLSVLTGRIGWKLDDRARVIFRQRYEDVDSDVATTYTRNTSTLALHVEI